VSRSIGVSSRSSIGKLRRASFPAKRPTKDMTEPDDLTHGHLLGGRVRYAQPRRGFRSGLEPVLLAAAIPARGGERVLEGGSGAGATLLCLSARVRSVQGLGVERDPMAVAVAQHNAAANGWLNLEFRVGDLRSLPELRGFDHACANPPYHSRAGTPSPDPSRRAAKAAAPGTLSDWAMALARPLRQHGTLTFVLPPAVLPAAMAAFTAAGCAPTTALPLWPRHAQPANLLLLRGVKGSGAAFRLLSGILLHTADGRFTEEAEQILRGGAALEL
jgi:tRNA1(Val) A37 N6-methylase TrmN6